MKKTLSVAAAFALAISLAGCGGSSTTGQAATPAESAAASGNYPVTVKSCENDVTFDKAPEKVLMMSETDAPILYDLGVMDHVKFRAGAKRIANENPEMEAAIKKIPEIKAGETETGGAKLSVEAVLEANPDLVIGFSLGIDVEGLKAANIKFYSPMAYCGQLTKPRATWDNVTNEIDILAKIFGVPEKGETLKTKVAEELKGIDAKASEGQSAAAIYVTPGSDESYTYGNTSMVQPIFEANGLKNAYGDSSERVFDVNMEDLLNRNPDWIVVLAGSAEQADAIKTFKSFSGASGLKAVQNNHVVFLPFMMTDPASTLSVQGAIKLGELIKK